MFKFGNGQKVRDVVSGFEGTIIGRADYLNGCKQYSVLPKCEDKNKHSEGQWIDEVQLEALNEGRPEIKSKPTGGPAINPPPGMTMK